MSRTRDLTGEEIRLLKYFWKEKRDVRRWASFQDCLPVLRKRYPEVVKALLTYESATVVFDLLLDAIPDKE